MVDGMVSKKTPWIFTGVFLFIGIAMIVTMPLTLPIALCLPSLYCIYSDKIIRMSSISIGYIPGILIFVPHFFLSSAIFVTLYTCGIIMHWAINKRMNAAAIFIPVIVLSILFAAGMSLASNFQDLNIIEALNSMVESFLDQMALMIPAGDIGEFEKDRPMIQSWIIRLFPSMMVSSLTFIIWINLLIVSNTRDLFLTEWKSPDWFVAVFVIAGGLTIIPDKSIEAVGLNLLIIVANVYFFQGIAISASYMKQRNMGRIIRWPIYLLILSQIYIMIAVSLVGLFDTWFNFRDKIRNAKGEDL